MPYFGESVEIGLRTSKFLSVDRFATSAISFCEVTTLKHELRDDAVETRTLVTEAMFTGGQFAEVPGGFGYIVIVEFEDDTSGRLAIYCDIKLKGEINSIDAN